ncbi:hypothetical protein [Tabrizicola oligotrophica]|uniref:Uncharacterized protein n=1 Tax=Tabrizicola oligotrophica TaxID=2710650 RepID=A0A6M0QUU3_9RHOB|nr:hypothetical protein [Tabrizicola oligotrophica]NEY91256.1 hypothetical protein [Tabrizicola oligotrophica]
MIFVSPLAGCADYLNHSDTITFGAGDAAEANTAIQTIYPFPNNVSNTDVTISP